VEGNVKLSTVTRDILELSLGMLADRQAGHVGSTITCALILGEQIAPYWGENDELVVSKAHASAAEYAYHVIVTHRCTREMFDLWGTELDTHSRWGNGIPFTLGSLGMGLSMACGLAMAQPDRRVWCIVGDGEMQSGNCMEAMSAPPRLNNLIVLLDENGAGACQDIPIPGGFSYPKNIGQPHLSCVDAHYNRITRADIPAIIAEIEKV
jgi:transketolase